MYPLLAAMYSMTPVAGAISGLISYGLDKGADGVDGLHSWQWLFIVEGGITIFFGLFLVALLPGLPYTVIEKGHFLFKREDDRRIIASRVRASMYCLLCVPYGRI